MIDIETAKANYESETSYDILENEKKLLNNDTENLKEQTKALEQKIDNKVTEIDQLKMLEKRIFIYKEEIEVLKNVNNELKLTLSQHKLELESATEESKSKAGDKLFNCDLYDKKYKTMIGFNKHIASKHETLVTSTEVKCENCSEAFQAYELLKKHNEEHQFVCDDCFMCFTSQFHADLHELEKHPDSVYAVKYIPNSTKELFLETKI